ncbi:MAG: hypothetical protein ACRDZ4_23000 [Egibacteraceae bacterium]
MRTEQGQTRWVTEIQAEQVCPSLRWAQAKPRKITRHYDDREPAAAASAPVGVPPSVDDDVPF